LPSFTGPWRMNHYSRRARRDQSSYRGAMSAWQVDLEEPERGSDGHNTFDCENNLLRRGRTIWLGALFVFRPRPESGVDYVVTGGST
jgi:hypothetical protein